MGHTHVLSGVAGWLALGPPLLAAADGASHLAGADLPSVSPGGLAAGVLVAGGAAMWPDVDHPSATIARTYGPLWQPVARVAEALSGGHREGTHSLAFLALTAAGATAALWSPIATGALVGVFVGLCLAGLGAGPPPRRDDEEGNVVARVHVKAQRGDSAFLYGSPQSRAPRRRPRPSRTPLRFLKGYAVPVTVLAGLAAWGWAAANGTSGFWWLPVAVSLGCLLHDVGDWCTSSGVPWLWPARREWRGRRLKSRRYELGLFTTASRTERVRVTAGLVLLIAALLAWRSGLAGAVLQL
jgi:membrane-bound metal-dependent hydrolase YbcI (DUF457 family)